MDLFFMCNNCGVEIKISTSQPPVNLSCPTCGTINHPPDQCFAQGAILAGYRILHRIAATGVSETYLAEPVKNPTLVKLQTLTSVTFQTGYAADYYMAAMRQWMRVRQPNIIKVLEAGRSSTGTFFAASSLTNGVTLEERLWRGGAVDMKAAVYSSNIHQPGYGVALERTWPDLRATQPPQYYFDSREEYIPFSHGNHTYSQNPSSGNYFA